jgi:hypothetical protein
MTEQQVNEYGIVASLSAKPAISLNLEGAYTVKKVCYNDTVSRVMPEKDCMAKLGAQMKTNRKCYILICQKLNLRSHFLVAGLDSRNLHFCSLEIVY